MKKDAKIFLKHIAESIEKIMEFTSGMDKDGFKNSIITQDAVMRRLEIIGEAAKNTPLDFQKKYSDIPWNEMAKTRDKLIHGYFGVDIDLTWDIIKNDIPEIETKINAILSDIENE